MKPIERMTPRTSATPCSPTMLLRPIFFTPVNLLEIKPTYHQHAEGLASKIARKALDEELSSPPVINIRARAIAWVQEAAAALPSNLRQRAPATRPMVEPLPSQGCRSASSSPPG